MKKLLANLGGKVAALADDISSYNDPKRNASLPKPSGPGHGIHGDRGAGSADSEPALDPIVEHLLRNVRSRRVRLHFAKTPVTEYMQHRSIKILAATFNVGGKKPPPWLRLDEWLGPRPAAGAARSRGGGDGGPSHSAPDVFAIGFEELVPLNAGNVMGVWANSHVDAWDRCIAVHLNGEDWASERYATATPPAVGQAAAYAASAAALLDLKWQGGAPQLRGTSGTSSAGDGSSPGSARGGSSNTNAGGSSSSDEEYVQVASRQLVGLYLSVWVRRKLLPEVRGVQVTTVSTGFGGYLGNKGAVAARMRLYDSSIVFVAAHLTAGDSEGDELRRNADVQDIMRRAVFSCAQDGSGTVAMTAAAASLISASLGPGHWPPGPSAITDHDLAIWVGDLNYRLSTISTSASSAAISDALARGAGVITDADARVAIRAGRLEPLQAADQLNKERAAGRVFRGWHEGPLTFLPTYKFKIGTHIYNGDDTHKSPSSPSLASSSPLLASEDPSRTTLSSAAVSGGAGGGDESESVATPAKSTTADLEKHKRRTPSWCDRVLWWCRGGGGAAGGGRGAARLEQLSYWRGELTVSDHKPVAAAFTADLVSYQRHRIEAALEAALRTVDMMQQSMRPRVTVEPTVLEAGEWVALGRPVPLRLTLTNKGTVEALYHFVPPPQISHKGSGGKFDLDDETPPLPSWLYTEAVEGVLQPGQSCELELTVLVDSGPGGAAGHLSAPPPPSTSAPASSTPLNSIVILRIEDSGDKFVTVTARYRHSFIGVSLDNLLALGLRPALPPAEAEELAKQLGLEPLQLSEPAHGSGAIDGAVAAPKELRALVAALLADSASGLQVPGILADSAALVLLRAGEGAAAAAAPPPAGGAAQQQPVEAGDEDPEDATVTAAAAMQPTGRTAQRALLRRLERLRLHLDAGGAVPPGTDPHDVAALLLLWCGQLPQPLIPSAVADAAAAAPPASASDAAVLLRRHCGEQELAVVLELLRLLRAAVEPAAADHNGLTAPRLAAAMSAWWMPPLAAGAAAGAGRSQRALLSMLLAGDAAEVELAASAD